MSMAFMRRSEIRPQAKDPEAHMVSPTWHRPVAALLEMVVIILFSAGILVIGVRPATAQGNPKPTTQAVPSDSTAPKPNPAAGQHVKPSHLESSGPDCFGADAADPICGPAHPTPKPPPSPTPAIPPMNLVWSSVDPVGWPLNPQWAWQLQPENSRRAAPAVDLCGKFHWNVTYASPTPPPIGSPPSGFPSEPVVTGMTLDLGHPPCTTTRLTFDSDAGFLADVGGFGALWPHGRPLCESSIPGSQNGHVNWMPATYTGPITYEDHDDALGHDGDYNMLLVPPDSAGLTTGEAHYMKVEFKDEETVDKFVTPFWETGEFQFVSGNYAIVTGVLGLDGVHDFDTELHPAYLVAIRITDPGSPSGTSNPERWAFFVRNWGNEGMCSHFNWLATPKVWVFKLPWRPSAKSVRVEETVFARNDGTFYDIHPYMEDGIIVAVGLGDPHDGNVVHGEITLYWDESGTAPRVVPPPGARNRPSIGSVADVNREIETARLDHAIARMPADAKTRFTVSIGAREKAPGKDDKKAVRREIEVVLPTSSIWKGPARLTLLQGVEDRVAKERNRRLVEALCEAYHGNVPEFPKLCQPH